jgi:hypothetical protein
MSYGELSGPSLLLAESCPGERASSCYGLGYLAAVIELAVWADEAVLRAKAIICPGSSFFRFSVPPAANHAVQMPPNISYSDREREMKMLTNARVSVALAVLSGMSLTVARGGGGHVGLGGGGDVPGRDRSTERSEVRDGSGLREWYCNGYYIWDDTSCHHPRF